MKRKHQNKPRPVNRTHADPTRHATSGKITCPMCGGTAHHKTKPDRVNNIYYYEITCPHCDYYIFDHN